MAVLSISVADEMIARLESFIESKDGRTSEAEFISLKRAADALSDYIAQKNEVRQTTIERIHK